MSGQLTALVLRETLGILATLTGVGLAANAVHRDGEGLVRLPGEGAERHRAGREALDDLACRLDLLNRDGVLLEPEEAAQCGEAGAVPVEVTGELLEGLEIPGLYGALEGRDARLVPLVVLALRPELVLAPDLELLGVVPGSREGAPVSFQGLARQCVHPDAANARGGARKTPVYEHLVHPHGLDVVLRRLLGANTLHEVRACEIFYRLEGEVRVNGGRAVADEEGEVVNLTRLSSLDDEGGGCPYACPHQVVVNARGGEEARYRGLRLVHASVAQDQDH